MTYENTPSPERYKTLAYPSDQKPTHITKIFKDPDFIEMSLMERRNFSMRWASNASIVQSVELLNEFNEQADFRNGTIVLKHTFERNGTIAGGANVLNGEPEDILGEVLDSSDRAIGYSLSNKAMQLRFGPSWPKTYHDIATNEIDITLKRTNRMARFIIDQAISLTAMEELRQSTDQTLDEFAEYLPLLRR